MKEKYKSPYSKEELFKMYPPLNFKRLAIGIVLSLIVMWVSSLILL